MTDSEGPVSDVDSLAARVQAEATRRRLGVNNDAAADGRAALAALEAIVADAEFRNRPRTIWPQRISFFPFSVPALQNIALKAINLLGKDHRAVDEALIDALRECASVIRMLDARIAELEARPQDRDP